MLANKDDNGVDDQGVPLGASCSLIFLGLHQVVDEIKSEELGVLTVLQIALEFLLEVVWFDRVLRKLRKAF